MKKRFPLLITAVFLAALGCEKQSHPSGAVDTSDPNKVIGTMAPMQKDGKDPTAVGGMPKGNLLPKTPGGK